MSCTIVVYFAFLIRAAAQETHYYHVSRDSLFVDMQIPCLILVDVNINHEESKVFSDYCAVILLQSNCIAGHAPRFITKTKQFSDVH
jgi:hypothetical protein